MTPAGKRRHIADLYEPSGELTGLGNQTDAGTRIASGIPCSFETLSSREQEVARMMHATASHRVTFFANPKQPVKHTHWLMVSGRKLNIAEIKLDDRGLEYDILCGEVVA